MIRAGGLIRDSGAVLRRWQPTRRLAGPQPRLQAMMSGVS